SSDLDALLRCKQPETTSDGDGPHNVQPSSDDVGAWSENLAGHVYSRLQVLFHRLVGGGQLFLAGYKGYVDIEIRRELVFQFRIEARLRGHRDSPRRP